MGSEAAVQQDRPAGMNVVAIAGSVGLIRYDEREVRQQECCSFTLSMDRGAASTFVRVNVYGSFVKTCRERLKTGVRVEVQGELMNRRSGGAPDSMFTEVRCQHLIFT